MSSSYSKSLSWFRFLAFLVAIAVASTQSATGHAQQIDSGAHDPLAEILLKKGILTPEDMQQIDDAATPQSAEKVMAQILFSKGVLTNGEYEQIAGKSPGSPIAASAQVEQPVQAQTAAAPIKPPSTSSAMATTSPIYSAPEPATKTQAQPAGEKPAAPSVVAAIMPLRVLPVGGVAREPFPSALKLGDVAFAPYGAIKVTAVSDSSSPYGDDFPLVGFLGDSGPDGSPEFHVKARGSRLGVNVAWFDPNPKWSISGKIEMDFEGNFNRSDNRNISTIRSSNASLRLAWGRMDYHWNDKNTISALFGQDWTPFGSSTLPSILESTSYGIGYGILWERTPQMRFGYTRKFSGVQFMPEFALAMPASGLGPSAANITQQLGYGERQGPDSNRPEFEGRIVTQWQLDHAAGVAPAQFIVSGERGSRAAIVPASSIPSQYSKTFATGVTGRSNTYGWDGEWQLPTRFLTFTGKFYSGAGLRYFLVNQLYTYFNDTAGLSNLTTLNSIDCSSTVVLGTNASGEQVIAPERPIRTVGGWAQAGVPLSRIFNANPSGRNAGWTFYALYSIDQAKTRDLNHLGASGNRSYSTMGVATLNYALNRWLTFSFEQSVYSTHANPQVPLPIFKGVPTLVWKDVREEFGPTFTF
jgi:hypothetical protein